MTPRRGKGRPPKPVVPLTAAQQDMVVEALPQALKACSRLIRWVARYAGVCEADAKSEVALAVCRAAQVWRDDGRPFQAFACGAGRRHLTSILCTQTPLPLQFPEGFDPIDETPKDAHEDWGQVEGALSLLGPQQETVCRAILEHRLDVPDAARLAGVSTKAAGQAYRTSLTRLASTRHLHQGRPGA